MPFYSISQSTGGYLLLLEFPLAAGLQAMHWFPFPYDQKWLPQGLVDLWPQQSFPGPRQSSAMAASRTFGVVSPDCILISSVLDDAWCVPHGPVLNSAPPEGAQSRPKAAAEYANYLKLIATYIWNAAHPSRTCEYQSHEPVVPPTAKNILNTQRTVKNTSLCTV